VTGFNRVFVAWQGILKLPKSIQRIQNLELRLAEVSVSLAELATLRRENEELRFLLGNTDQAAQRRVITSPIIAFARPAVAVGSANGVEIGSVVLSRGILLGQVSKVSSHEAEVTLLSAVDAKPVLAKTVGGTMGLVRGDGRKILLTEVTQTLPLAIGELVVTVGQLQIEQNLVIGRVTSIQNDPANSVKQAVIEQLTSFFEVSLVEIR
jgi:cell shape-determining protein MreC